MRNNRSRFVGAPKSAAIIFFATQLHNQVVQDYGQSVSKFYLSSWGLVLRIDCGEELAHQALQFDLPFAININFIESNDSACCFVSFCN